MNASRQMLQFFEASSPLQKNKIFQKIVKYEIVRTRVRSGFPEVFEITQAIVGQSLVSMVIPYILPA